MLPSQPRNLYDVDPEGTLRLHFHPGQARAWISKKRHVLVLAGTQGGKTSFGPWWLHREIYGGFDWPGRGGGDYLAVTSNFDLFKLKMLPELRTIFEEVLDIGRYWAGDRVIELRNPNNGKYSNGSHIKGWGRIILRSAVAGAGLEASTAKAAWLDEVGQDEWDVTAWEAVQRRLSLYQGRSLGTTTVYNSGWLKSEVYDRWVAGDPDFDVVQFPSFINPSFPRIEFDKAKQRLPDWRFKMFYLGQFGKPVGLVYSDFTDEMVIDAVEIKPYWPLIIGLDFGGVNNATVFIVENTDKSPSEYYAYAEFIDGHMPIESIVNLTKERIGPREYKARIGNEEKTMLRKVTVVGGAGSEDVWRQEWSKSGLYVHRPPVGDVEVGILSVIAVIKSKRFYIFRNCSGLRHEFNTYRRMTAADGTVSDTIVDKATFHRLDAVRYAFVTNTTPQIF